MQRLILAAPCIALGLMAGGCASGKPTQELSLEAVCLQHFENDPIGRDRCRLPPETRGDSVPDVAPQQLPLRTGQLGD